ncbi:uncharacterized protein [Branchiostoma lanceolatum]|uniref:uncharacterized protein n=1 Tax=Branchiostoma lanceolatum TaxID=7740 RepID=UPI003454965F
MYDIKMTSLASKLRDLESWLESQHGKGYGQALREAILSRDCFIEAEVLKSLGDLKLQKAILSKDSAEFDKTAALYAAALLRCTDPDMGQTLEHRIGYMEKLSRQVLQGNTPRYQPRDYWGSNVLRVAKICYKVDKRVGKPWHSVEEIYTEILVTAIGNSDIVLELEVLKSFGDLYLKKGKKTSEVSQFSKAAAMYNKALTRCGDPETKLTLEHRIRYMDKSREAATRKSRERRPKTGHQSGTDITQDQHLHPDRTSPYRDHLKQGDSSLTRADLDSAEQHFAAALKLVHVTDPTAQQYQREVEPLFKLGDVYSKRGQQTGDGGDFVKAAALYNAAIAKSEDQVLNCNIDTDIREVEKAFMKCILKIHPNVSQDNTEKHKKQLKEMRDQIKLEMETWIDQQLDPYALDEDDPCVKKIEAKRAQAVRHLFENIVQQRKEFISLLVEECIGLMGRPPCKYALIGLGSQATGLVTPYSDLEFAILVEEESKECLVYFRNLTHYLHLKVVNLGETILPALGIKSLNDFYSKDPLDNWFYDSVTPRGFAFDGSMPKASKTPLGRQGTKNEPPSELICTPENMASILQKDVTLYLKEGYHLATVLRNPCLIAGDQELMGTYMNITVKKLQDDGGKMAQQLVEETLKEDMMSNRREETITARLMDVKKEIYRFPAVAVDCLALYSGIVPTTVWETIEKMENQQVISANNAHHLTVLASISAELRLRTYIANGGQKENLSAIASMETALHGLKSSLQTKHYLETNELSPVFHLQNEKQLFRYYFTVIPLRRVLSKCRDKKIILKSFSDFYDNSPEVQGSMYSEICNYRSAISCYKEALKKDELSNTAKIDLLQNLGDALHMAGNNRKAISYHEQALQRLRSYGKCFRLRPKIVKSLSDLGGAWDKLGDNQKAISYHEQALQMERSIYGQTTPHSGIATSLNNLGGAYSQLGDYKKAISYYEQALQMFRDIHGQSTAHPAIATSLRNLGAACCDLGDNTKGIRYQEQALQMLRTIYGDSTAHPEIAISLNNLRGAWDFQGDYRKALSYTEQVLQMYRSIYGGDTAHPDIATFINNLGTAWWNLGNYRKAISYYEQALQMRRIIYGQSTEHHGIAESLSSLGSAWYKLGDCTKAISYHKQALNMQRSIYGQNTAHSHIAISLNQLGEAWHGLGDYSEAISYYEQALQMFRDIYGKAHALIATSLNNLGSTWYKLGDYKKAKGYYEEALEMRRRIYGQDTAHHHIAESLHNLGMAWYKLGDCKKAISLRQEALDMERQIYRKDKSPPSI